MNEAVSLSGISSPGFPAASPALETFGLKFSSGGAHISRTMMLAELGALMAVVPQGSRAADYRDAILQQNVLGKTTDSTRQKSLRHLRELYALDEGYPDLRAPAEAPREGCREPATAGSAGSVGARPPSREPRPGPHGRIRG